MKALCLVTWALLASGCGTLVDSRGGSGVQVLGPDGGTIDTDFGVRLYVPPGALHETVTVMLVPLAGDAGAATHVTELRPVELVLALPGIITFRSPSSDRDKVASFDGAKWSALAGRLVEASGVSSAVTRFGAVGLVSSTEVCSGGVDDDGDALVDCADPVCAGDDACPQACTTNADCACGSVCRGGGCGAPAPRFCSSSAECADVACAVPVSHGATCGFLACARTQTAGDGGTSLPQVASCLGVDDQCSCEACLNQNQCPGGTLCREGTRKHGSESCGKNVCF